MGAALPADNGPTGRSGWLSPDILAPGLDFMGLFRLNSRDENTWTAVVFDSQAVHVARVGQTPGARPVLQAWDSYPRQGGDLDVLKRLKGAGRLGPGRCTLLLPRGQYQLQQIEAPEVPAAEMRDAVRWKMKDAVDFPIENAGIDVLPPVAAGRANQIYAVAASRAVLQSWVQLFQAAKAPLDAIDVPELAQRNIAALFEEADRGLALLAFDAGGGQLTFTYGGELYFSRHIDALPVAAGSAAATGLRERALLDVQRTLDNVDRGYSGIPIARLLVSPPPGVPDVVDYLRENLYQPVETLDLGQRIDLGGSPTLADPLTQGPALLAIGAALRGAEKPA